MTTPEFLEHLSRPSPYLDPFVADIPAEHRGAALRMMVLSLIRAHSNCGVELPEWLRRAAEEGAPSHREGGPAAGNEAIEAPEPD